MTTEERFWSKVDKSPSASRSGECWVWRTGNRPLFKINNKNVYASRVSYQWAHPDEDISDVIIRHTCDNPPCVNPAHLVTGTHKDNSDDKMLRGRRELPLSNSQVEDIRSRPLSITMCRDLAEEFGVTTSQIKSVLEGRSYAWIPGAREVPPQFTGYKLTHEEVVYIAKRMENHKYGDQKELAERFGVTRLTIANIKYRRRLYTDTL